MDVGPRRHWGIFLDTNTNIALLLKMLSSQTFLPESHESGKDKGVIFSKLILDKLLKEEALHDKKTIDHIQQPLRSMSSGEQKKALLAHLLKQKPAFLILDRPFDHLDKTAQAVLRKDLFKLANDLQIIQLIDRKVDTLAFISNFIVLKENTILAHSSNSCPILSHKPLLLNTSIPEPLEPITSETEVLIAFKNVSVSFEGRPVLKAIHWSIKTNEFWQLTGRNGSGKTTLLSMITGENSKAYGQEIFLFGRRKGSGESIWDIKEKIGYFSPRMTNNFPGHHSVEHMLISGLYDSVGLYTKPSDAAIRLARKWLILLDMLSYKDVYFKALNIGQQRIIMTVRAMIKHPLLLILDEPTTGLDDRSATLFVSLINTIAAGSTTSIIFVSHRKEPGLAAKNIYSLEMTKEGSTGRLLRL